jgi:hypothetical protein
MCYEEFNKLFCKGMFKKALINILDELQRKSKKCDEENQKKNAGKTLNLSNLFGTIGKSASTAGAVE